MKRIRTIKPEFFTSEDVTAMPVAQRLTFIGLMFYVDDYGNENAKTSLIKAAIWPEDDDITADVIETHLLDLAEHGQIVFYSSGRRTYLSIVNWKKHQRVDRPSPTNVPKPSEEALASGRREPHVREGREGGGEGESGRASEGEREREGAESEGSEGTSRATPPRSPAAATPPSAFCSAHPAPGTLAPCRACGNARLARKQWDDEQEAGPPHHQPEPVTFKPSPEPSADEDDYDPRDE